MVMRRSTAGPILLGDWAQTCPGTRGKGCGETGLAGAGWAVEQDIHAGLAAGDSRCQQGSRNVCFPPQVGESIPWQGGWDRAAKELLERVLLWGNCGAHQGAELADHVEIAITTHA
jgi:hypothetical protein